MKILVVIFIIIAVIILLILLRQSFRLLHPKSAKSNTQEKHSDDKNSS